MAKPIYMKTLIVKIDEQDVELKKLPIGEYAELLKSVKQLPKHFRKLENLTTDKIVELLPEIISDCLPDVVGILGVATKLSDEEINQMGLDDITKLVVGVFEVNNYAEVFKTLKKVTAHPAIKQQVNPKTS